MAERAGDRALTIRVEPSTTTPGLELVDPIERHRYSLLTPSPVEAEPIGTDRFRFPVDTGVAVTAGAIRLPTVVPVYVRDASGSMLVEAEHFADESLPDGTYSIEVCAPIKIYLRVRSPISVTAGFDGMELDFGEEARVLIGARSHHKRPAGTVVTTDDPHDVMAAISTFGSALKSTSPERSYPTLRGHPPLVELGERLEIPDGLEPPETGIEVAVPPEYRHCFVAAPLAYYLGAELTPAADPAIVTEHGYVHALEAPDGFEAEVERVLKQAFFLDCVTRTEGLYRIDLHERHAVEAAVDLDFAAVYEEPIAERLETYLGVPFEVTEPHLPEWKLTTHIDPVARSVEQLPFVVNDLAVVRSSGTRLVPASSVHREAIEAFTRTDVVTRSASAAGGPDRSFVRPDPTDSLEHAWIGDRTPVGASKTMLEAFRNRLDREPSTGDIAITVVCNEGAMAEEGDLVDEVYGTRERLPFEVTIARDLTTGELRDVLTGEADFLHYVGHIDRDGIQCADGRLDASDLDDVAVEAFLLNACESYDQGMALIEAGAIGGVVTLSEVINTGAVQIGRAMARLLNAGFPLGAALTIARDESVVGGQYIVVGDGGLAITQSESGVPLYAEIEPGDGAYTVGIKTFPTTQKGIGTTFIPFVEDNETHFLGSGSREFEMDAPELEEFLSLDDFPVRTGDRLAWSGDLDVSTL